jgi:hypothetical protein
MLEDSRNSLYSVKEPGELSLNCCGAPSGGSDWFSGRIERRRILEMFFLFSNDPPRALRSATVNYGEGMEKW